MLRIIPIRDLKNTSEISQMCHENPDPIYVTKNGYGDMVVMSVEAYEEKLLLVDIYQKLEAAGAEIAAGKTIDADESLRRIREKYHV